MDSPGGTWGPTEGGRARRGGDPGGAKSRTAHGNVRMSQSQGGDVGTRTKAELEGGRSLVEPKGVEGLGAAVEPGGQLTKAELEDQ